MSAPQKSLPQAGPGAAAAARLRQLGQEVAALFPDREPVPLRGKEQERMAHLEALALRLARLRPLPGAPQDPTLLRRAAALRGQAGATLGLLGSHAARELRAALERSLRRWDQAGDLLLLPPAGRSAALGLHGACDEALALLDRVPGRSPGGLALLCAAAEASAAVDAACALLRALELRFVIVLRERLLRVKDRGEAAEREALLPGGEPFLDLGGALCAAAAAFGWEGEAGGQHG